MDTIIGTICHNDDDLRDDDHRRVTLALRSDGRIIAWDDEIESEGEGIVVDSMPYVYLDIESARDAAAYHWRAIVWDFRLGE
jgi:hypothetical protein